MIEVKKVINVEYQDEMYLNTCLDFKFKINSLPFSVQCFDTNSGDWCDVSTDDLEKTSKFFTQMYKVSKQVEDGKTPRLRKNKSDLVQA